MSTALPLPFPHFHASLYHPVEKCITLGQEAGRAAGLKDGLRDA